VTEGSRKIAAPDTHVRAQVAKLRPYHVPDATGLVKLDAMENPYPWPGELIEQWRERLTGVEANRYPDPAATRLKQRLRNVMGVPNGASVLVGNGSDEIIQMLAMALAVPGGTIVAPEPSFVMYRMIASFLGLNFVGVPLGPGFSLDADAMVSAVRAQGPSLAFIAQPNNPTGNLFDPEAVRTVIREAPSVVVVDEAYFPFTDETLLGSVLDFPNLLVMRTVSKLGLAGLRLGFLVGAPGWITEIDKLRMPYNVNTLTQLSVEFALQHSDVLATQTRGIRKDRDRLIEELRLIEGLEVFPSAANFVLFRVPTGAAERLFEGLLGRGVLIKNLSSGGGVLTDCLRVTVGTPAEIEDFLLALRDCLRNLGSACSSGR